MAAPPCGLRARGLFHAPTLESGRGSVPEDRGVFSGPTPGLFPSAVTASTLAILASIRRGFNRVASKGGGEGNGDHLGGRRGARPRIPAGRAARPGRLRRGLEGRRAGRVRAGAEVRPPGRRRSGRLELRALEIIKDIRHPHLLATFGAWQVGRHLIIAMELAERTLLDRFREAVGQGFPGIPAPEIHEHFLDAAEGLDYLNEPRHPSGGAEPVGIQHRDVKPQNLLLVGGSVKVADFGLARILEHTQTSHTGSMTPAYAAPEFFKKQTSSQSDQYSLAVTYCHLRGGRLPFTGSMAEVMAGHLLRAARPDDASRGGACGGGPGSGQGAEGPLAELPGVRGGVALGGPRPGPRRPDDRSDDAGVGDVPPRRGEERRRRPPKVRGVRYLPADPHRVPAGPLGCSTRGPSRRSATAMSDRGRKVLALSLSLTALSVVVVLGLWALGVLAPVGRSPRDPWPDPGRSTLRHKARGPGHRAPPEPPVLQGRWPLGRGTQAPKRAPTLSLDVPASEPGSATSERPDSRIHRRPGVHKGRARFVPIAQRNHQATGAVIASVLFRGRRPVGRPGARFGYQVCRRAQRHVEQAGPGQGSEARPGAVCDHSGGD